MERQLVTFLLICLWIVVICGMTHGANPTFDADEQEFWDGTAAVILAKVADVQQNKEAPVGNYKINLQPLACVAGLLNPASHPILVADYSLGLERRTVPKTGDWVLVVVFERSKLSVPRPGFGVANGRCSFMPDNQPLVVLSGMGDPVVLDVLRKLQAARHPATAPSTHPAGG